MRTPVSEQQGKIVVRMKTMARDVTMVDGKIAEGDMAAENYGNTEPESWCQSHPMLACLYIYRF